MYYVLIYKTIENYLSKKEEYLKEHLNYTIQYISKGELILSGTLVDPLDTVMFVFKTEKKDSVFEFALNDPYVINGLIKSWEVRKWNVEI